jgi:hypothetical protein
MDLHTRIALTDTLTILGIFLILGVLNVIKENPDPILEAAARAFRAIGRLFK